MPVYVTFLVVCDKCGATQSHARETGFYSDELIDEPPGWGWIDEAHCVCEDCYSRRAEPPEATNERE